MTEFTTRPELSGTFGMVTSTHWLASSTGMRMLESGGNAFDAAVAAGFVLNVVEPHLNGPLGEVPVIFHKAGDVSPTVLCGQGVAPSSATIEHYRSEGLSLIPGTGLLACVVPGAFDAWMLMLRDHGTQELRTVLEPAIHYARHGHPLLASVAATIRRQADFFREHWPTSARIWLPGGSVPQANTLFRNPELADFWENLLAEVEAADNREARIEAARGCFYRGFVAEKIESYLADAEVLDASGARHRGVLTADDMSRWSASYEAPVSVQHAGWEVFKCGAWSQGPSLLQSLQVLRNDPLGELDPNGPDFVHLVTETLKLGFADRDAFYGDPDHVDVPLEILLSDRYADARRAMITDNASADQRPGDLQGREMQIRAFLRQASAGGHSAAMAGEGEPTMDHLHNREGDTCHVDVVDRMGNSVSATPSGGWLQSSPVVPGLGVPLNTRAQMFWLDPERSSALAPGHRPRTTLSPSLAIGPDGEIMPFGTPGGDQQDQWQLIYFLRHVHHRMNMQEAIDAPLFHTAHLQASFYPRGNRPAHLMAEPGLGSATLAELSERGHDVELSAPWEIGRLTAAKRQPDGILKAAATPRLMQAYAVGR